MKKPSVTIILILCIFLFQTSFSAAAAATSTSTSTYEDYAETLSDLGVFVGTGSGFELDRAPTRIEGLVMLIRLLGAEEEAKAMQGKTLPFSDVPKWATGYVAYAYDNGLTNGVSATKFGSTNKMEAKAFLTFLLRSLGYNDQAGDFSYNNALTYSKSISLINDKMYSTLNNGTFLRAYIAKTAYDTLKFPFKGGDVLLIDKLIAENKIDKTVGAHFKKVVLTEPAALVVPKTGAVSLEDNLKSVVMLECYDSYNDPYVGSGVILSSDGRIVTNYHVIEEASDIDIVFDDETVYKGDVYIEDYDKELDLAVLKINKTGLTPATIGDSTAAKAGASVITIGSPLGYLNTVTEGIISAVRSGSIQISAAINPGNSGGGLFDANGKLIGITNAGYLYANNMGFAIPVEQLSKVSKSQKIALKDFYAKTIGPLPSAPTGLGLLYETKTTAFLKWNAVTDAEWYDIYLKTSTDDDYYFLDLVSADEISVYGYLAVEMTPGEQYSFKVTTERGEQESDLSTAFTFKKSSGDVKYGSFTPYYSEYPKIPDFGKLAGITPYKKEAKQYSYKLIFEKTSSIVYTDYTYLLEDCGFAFVSTTTNADGSATDIYKNAAVNQTVTLTAIPVSEEEGILTIKID